jgi:flagellar basal-body rod modification protein FlgD
MQAQNALMGAPGGALPKASITEALGGGADPGELFTTLLVAQIRNQNPLEPTDPSEFVGQLTQLSQAEAMHKLLAQSGAQAALLSSLQTLAVGASVGSRVMVGSDTLTAGSAPIEASVRLPAATEATAVLTGADGREHRVLLGRLGAGDQAFVIDPAALGLTPGRYGIAVHDAAGARHGVEIAGEVTAVRLSPGGGLSLNVMSIGEIDPSVVTRFIGRKP